ncbi:adenine phosphoribosyltransferase [[Clostridium] ultunense Esp]|nr:adenine phosphoribosyltransferase [[Clostridium] ultunense Esp]
MINLKDYIRIIPDFPQPGIVFKDITTLLKDGIAYKEAIDAMVEHAEKLNIDLIAGPEARGFVIGAPIAYALGVGFVPIRKSGKLPAETVTVEYEKEYGIDVLAIHQDAIKPGQKVLVCDDLLATGGTIKSTVELVKKLGGDVVGTAFLIELTYLEGRKNLGDLDVFSLVKY